MRVTRASWAWPSIGLNPTTANWILCEPIVWPRPAKISATLIQRTPSRAKAGGPQGKYLLRGVEPVAPSIVSDRGRNWRSHHAQEHNESGPDSGLPYWNDESEPCGKLV